MTVRSKRRYSILYTGPLPPPYHGSAVMIKAFKSMLLRRGEFLSIHIDTSDHRPASTIGKWDIPNIVLGLRHAVQFALKLVRFRPDLVYIPISQNTPAFLRDSLFLIPSIWSRRKIVLHLHGSYFSKFYHESSPVMRMLIRYVLHRTTHIIVLGDNLRRIFHGFVSSESISVVPNGIPHDIYTRGTREIDKETTKRPLRAVFLGSMQQSKGYRDVLRAATVTKEMGLGIQYTLIGEFRDIEEQEWANEYIRKYNIHNSVSLVGQKTGIEKANMLKNSDVFVFPTYYPYEGHPLVVLEAMASGLPVITTDQGAIRETILDGKNGYILPKHDPMALAKTIARFNENNNLLIEMSKANRERFFEKYTIESWEENMTRVLLKVAEADGAQRDPRVK